MPKNRHKLSALYRNIISLNDNCYNLEKRFMATIFLSILLLALGMAGIAIKILVKKNGRFSGTCSSNNPLIQREGEACSICGAKPQEKCKS
jgi:hypothetical protein